MSAHEINRQVAKLSTEAVFKLKDRNDAIPVLAAAHEAARQAALSFFCIRIICDPAGRKVEKDLLAGVDSRGNSRPMRLINPLIRRPWLLAPLLIMARDFTLALAGMRRVWNVVQKPLADFAGSNSTTRASDGDL